MNFLTATLPCSENAFCFPSLVGPSHSELHYSLSYVGGPHFEKCGSVTFNLLFLRWVCHLLLPSSDGVCHIQLSYSQLGISLFYSLFHMWVHQLLKLHYFHRFSIEITSSHFLHFWVCQTVKNFLVSGASATYTYSQYVDPPRIQTLPLAGTLNVRSPFTIFIYVGLSH